MAHLLKDATFMVKVSVILLMIRPLLDIKRIKHFITAWNPAQPIFENLDVKNNDNRIADAEAYLRHQMQLNASWTRPPVALTPPDNPMSRYPHDNPSLYMVVAIVTVRRPPRARYLIQTAARMHELVRSDSHCDRKMVFICNIDNDYNNHDDAVYLRQYMNYVDRSGYSNFKLPHPPKVRSISAPQPTNSVRRKEIEDYLFCLNISKSFNPKYVLMLEDDAIAHRDMFKVLRFVLDSEVQQLSRHSVTAEIDHLKLFSFDHLSNVREYIIQVVRNYSVSVLCGASFVIAAVLLSSGRLYRYTTLFAKFARGLLAGSILVFFIGNSFYMELFRVSPFLYTLEPLQRSSSAALVFRSDMVDGLVDYFMYMNTGVSAEGHKDLAIDNYIYAHGLNGYLIKPYVIEHIGTLSSLDR